MKNFIRFRIAPYALLKTLLALDTNGVSNIAITQEDNELVVSLTTKEIHDLVYKSETVETNDQLKILHKALGICAKEHDREPTDYVGKAMKQLCCCVCFKVLDELPKIDTFKNRYCKKHYEEHCREQQAEQRLKEEDDVKD